MSHLYKTIGAALVALACSATLASALDLDLQGGGQVKPRVTKIQLGVLAPEGNVCPGQAKLNVWVFSNKPSTFPILLVSDNGVVLGPYQVETVKGANNVTIGTWSDTMLIGSSISTSYHVVTPHSDISSPWVPLTVSC